MKEILLLQMTIIVFFIYYIQMTGKIIKTKRLRNLQIKKEGANDSDDKNGNQVRNLNFIPGGNMNNPSEQNNNEKDNQDNFNENPTFNDSNIGDNDFQFSSNAHNFSDDGENDNNNSYENENNIEGYMKEEEIFNEEKNNEENNIKEEENNKQNENNEEDNDEENINEENNKEGININENTDIEKNIEENEENINNQTEEDNENEELTEVTNDYSLNKPPDDKQEEPPDDKQEEPPDDKPPDDKPPDDKPQDEPPDKPLEEKEKGKEDIKKEFGPKVGQLASSGQKIVDSNYIISAVEVGKVSSLSRVDLSKCIQLLINSGIVSSSDSLMILQIDSSSENKITSDVSYALYFSNGTQIDLSLCDDTEVKITSSVNTSMISNYDEAKYIYENNKYDIFDINDPFYNDICTSYTSDDGTDVTLKDRQNNYFESISFCDDNCHYAGYDFKHDLVNCICNSTNNNSTESFSLNTFFKKFINVFKESNIKLVKCYNKVFELEKLKKNIGSYIMIGLFGLELIILILYCEIGLVSNNQIYEMIIKEMEKKKNKEKKNSNKKNNSMNGTLDITGISVQSNNNLNESQKHSFNEKIKSFKLSPFKQLPPYNKKISEINSHKSINNNDINVKTNITEIITKNIIIYSKKKYGLTSIATPRKEAQKINKFISKNKFKKNKTFILNHKRNLDNFDKDLTDDKLNKLPYEQAVEKDKRSFSNYYLSEIKNSQSFIFTFLISDENNKFIKIILFIFNISMYFCFNTLFFSDDSISHIYSNSGSYDYIYFIPKSIISTLISGIINIFFKFLALNNSKKLKVSLNSYKKYFKTSQIKLGIFFLMQFLFLLFFWYFTSSFCAVYVNTQKHLFKNCIISFLFSMIFPFFYVIIITILRLVGIRKKNKILYNISKFLSFF